MSSRHAFAGSKRAAREVARVKRELQAIATLAPFIRDDDHLQDILNEVLDEDQRAAVRTLITPFLCYRVARGEAPPC